MTTLDGGASAVASSQAPQPCVPYGGMERCREMKFTLENRPHKFPPPRSSPETLPRTLAGTFPSRGTGAGRSIHSGAGD